MSVVIETTLGDITVDLFLTERPRACLNFLKLCKIKYYNFNLFHTISRSFMAQTGDPTGSRSGGESIFGILDGPLKRFFEGENEPRIKHTKMGLISFVGNEERMIGSQFFLTLGEDLTYLDEKHCVFGEVVEGFDILEIINEVICDTDDRPYQDVRITHTVVLDDPYPDPKKLLVPSRSPSPSAERLQGGRIAPDEEIDEMEGKPPEEIAEIQAAREAKARATILEMVGDLPDADMAPPENVLFVCKLNPVTSDDDLEIIFSRFGKIKSCEVIRDKKTGDSLQYAFVEFEEQKSCENAYFKMDNVLIDDRRIHVDFSQSVSKIKWHGKGRGVTHYDDRGKKSRDNNNDIGKGNYKSKGNAYHNKGGSSEKNRSPKRIRNRSRTPLSPVAPKRTRDNSRSPSRDKNKSRHERDRSFKGKDFISPEGSGLKTDSRENHKNRERNGERSGKTLSPKMSSRSPTPRKTRYNSKSPRRSRDRSKSYDRKTSRTPQRIPRRSREMSPSPSGRSGSRSYMDNRTRYGDSRYKSPNNNYYNSSSKYNKTVPSRSSGIKRYSPEGRYVHQRRERSVSKERKTNMKDRKSKVEYKRKEKTKRKKSKSSSEDSDSDSDSEKKPKKLKKHSSSSSDSEDYHKKRSKKKKKRSKKKRDSSSDSEESVTSKKSKKKKKKKSDSG